MAIQTAADAAVKVELEKRSATSTFKDPAAWLLNMFPTTKSKVVVNRNTAKTISAVYASAKIISEGMASLPFNVINEVNGNKRIAKDHPVFFLIAKEPNSLQTSYTFRRQLYYDALLKGDGFAYIHRNRAGVPVRLEYIFDAIPYLKEDGSLWYQYTKHYGLNGSNSSTYYTTSDNMIHISGLSENGVNGIDVILAQRENLGIAISAQDYVAAYFGNNAHSGGIIKHPARLSPDAALRLSQSFHQKYGGVDNMGRPPVLDEGMDYVPTGNNPQQSSLIDIRKFQVEDVSRMFTVPMHLLSALDRATFNNIEVMNTSFVNQCLGPWAENTEQEFDRKLFSESEKIGDTSQGSFFTNYDFKNLKRGDTEARAKYYQSMFNVGAMSPNEIRREENLNDREGGDEYFTPLNFTNDPNQINNGKGNQKDAA